MTFEWLNQFEDFVSQRPEAAFLVCSLVVNTHLFRLLIREKDAHLATVKQLFPLAERLTALLHTAATKARSNRQPHPTAGA
jgi:hypothetical protein